MKYYTLLSFIFLTSQVCLGQNSSQTSVDLPDPVYPIPTQKQLDWQELEFYGFIHFTVNTFTDKEWGFGDESPEVFNPTELDPRQWAKVAKEAGMTGLILTAKHHDGFCLWPSEYTEHSVKNSPWKNGKGDVVQEFYDACQEYGLKFGVYLSPWDRNHPEYGREEYITYFRNQLKELLTGYGEVFEMWFDGANGGSGYYGGANETRRINTLEYYDWEETYKLIYDWSPNTLVWGVGPAEARWIGNERGIANKTNWSMLRQKDNLAGKVHYTEFMSGHIDGEAWVPGEADVSIRPGWFYHQSEDDKVRSLEEMVDIYYKSIGRNATLLLNIPPDQRGLFHDNDIERLHEMVHVIKEDLKTNLLTGITVTASNTRGNIHDKFGTQNLIDGDKDSYWTTDDGVIQSEIIFEFEVPTVINRVLLQEYIALGQRVKEFEVLAKVDDRWLTIASETTIGYKRILRTENVSAQTLKIVIKDARGIPVLSNIEAFHAPRFVRNPQIQRDGDGIVSIEAEKPTDNIYFTIDGSEPTLDSSKYTESFSMPNRGVIKAFAYDEINDQSSAIIHQGFGSLKTDWKIIKLIGGSEENAQRIIDGDYSTRWTSDSDPKAEFSITIDLNRIVNVKGFTYMPRSEKHDLKHISNFAFYVSNDNSNWTKVSEGEFSNIVHNPILQSIEIEPVDVQYIRLISVKSTDDSGQIAIAEIGIVE